MGYFHKKNAIYTANVNLTTGDDRFICNASCRPITSGPKPADEIRIFVLGGSSVAGMGDFVGSETITGQMEKAFSDAPLVPGKTVRVVNAGVGGYFSAQQLSRLVHEVMFLEPDVVIFLDGNNDFRQWEYINSSQDIKAWTNEPIVNWHSYDYSLDRGFKTVQLPAGAVLHTLNIISQAYPIFHYTTGLAKHLRFSFSKSSDSASPQQVSTNSDKAALSLKPIDSRINNSAYTYVKNIDSAAAIIRGSGLRGIFCLQPNLAETDPAGNPLKRHLTENEVRVFAATESYRLDYTRYFSYVRANYNHKVKESRVIHCDLSSLFIDTEEEIYSYDQVHYNKRGNFLISRSLVEMVRSMYRE